MPLSTGTRVGFFEIVAPLGAGGMGEVYRARDTKLNRSVAIKVLLPSIASDPDRLARFSREAQVLAALNHPNIATIYGVEDAGCSLALVMELVDGATLAERISQGPIPLAESLGIARQIAAALEAAHAQGIIHRDLKPSNIKVRPHGTVKVLDFGLAKAVDSPLTVADAMNSPTLTARGTREGVLLGTAAYMSPEQAVGRAANKRSDLWAFGVVLMEMLTGRAVFEGETVSHVLACVLKNEPDWTSLPTDTPPAIRRLLRRCLEKDWNRRLDSPADAGLEIDDALATPDELAISSTDRGSRFARLRIAAVVCGLLATAAAVLLGPRLFQTPAPNRPLVKLSMEPPQGATFVTTTVSPDGRLIAFTAVDATGHTDLWLRSLDSLESRRVPDTQGAAFPFWSPDSQYVGYWSRGVLRRVAASGGPPQAICAATALRGASWSSNGVIIFSPDSNSALWSVSAAGGTPQQLTTLDVPQHETSHRWPSFLADGRHYLFTVRSSQPQARGIYLAAIDSRDRTRLVEDLSNAVYAGDSRRNGWLLFGRGGSLLGQTLDITTRRLSEQPTMLTDKLSVAGAWSLALFSASDRVLIYQSASALESIGLVWFDRTGRRVATPDGFGVRGNALRMSITRDEHQIVLDSLDAMTGTFKLWTVDVIRGISSRVTAGANESERTPVWSPDGRRIAFVNDEGIVEKNAGGANPRTLLRSAANSIALADWSPDGRFLLFTRVDATHSTLWLLDVTAEVKAPVRFTAEGFNAAGGAFSPDGKWIAYQSDMSGTWEVYVQPVSTETGSGWQKISSAGGVVPHWRADGMELFYLTTDRSKLMSVPFARERFNPGVPVTLFDLPFSSIRNDFLVAKNGQRFLIPAATAAPPESAIVFLNWESILPR